MFIVASFKNVCEDLEVQALRERTSPSSKSIGAPVSRMSRSVKGLPGDFEVFQIGLFAVLVDCSHNVQSY